MSNLMKVALITGGGSGIGRAVAIEFAKKNYQIAIIGRREFKLDETVDECIQAGLKKENIKKLPGDVVQDDQVKQSVDKTIATFGRLDVLVNNAGNSQLGLLSELPLEDLDYMYRLHTRAPLLYMQLSLPHLQKTKGNIINVSSLSSDHNVYPAISPYVIGKTGMNTLTRLGAIEFGAKGVRVNSVLPGTVKTDIFFSTGAITDNDRLERFLNLERKRTPLGIIGEAEEVAKTIIMLADDEISRFTNGAMIRMDGGRHLLSQ